MATGSADEPAGRMTAWRTVIVSFGGFASGAWLAYAARSLSLSDGAVSSLALLIGGICATHAGKSGWQHAANAKARRPPVPRVIGEGEVTAPRPRSAP